MTDPCPHEFAEPESYGICTLCGEPAPWSDEATREPSREAREAAERLVGRFYRGTMNAHKLARALDAFAEKWREKAERRNVAAGEASAKFLEEHRQRVKAEQERDALRRKLSAMHRRAQVAEGELVKMRDPHEWMRRAAMVQQLSDIAKHNDALRRRVSDLQRRVDHCECESLIDHVRDCLPEYEHDDNAHGESEPFNEIETIEEAGREIDALRRRVAELEALVAKPDPNTRLRDAASAIMENIKACDEQPDDEGYCSCARTILSWLRHYELNGIRWRELHAEQKARAEAAEAALDEIIDMDAYEIHEGSVDPQAVAREARRARGET